MKTVLIYVLASKKDPYRKMIDTAMATWDAEPLEGSQTMYYTGYPTAGDTDRIISFPVTDELNFVGRITLAAFTHALKHWTWDYLARPNISCYVHKRRLLDHCQNLPERGVIQGIKALPTYHCGVLRPFLWGGGQYILSRDVVENLVGQQARWKHTLMEDVAMSELALDCGHDLGDGLMCSLNKKENDGWNLLAYGGKPGFDFTEWKEVSKADDQFYFRCKHDPDRNVDAMVMRLLKENLPV